MIKTAKKILRSNRKTASLLNLYFLYRINLKPSGWVESRYKGQSIDENNEAIPWFTYSCIHFIKERIVAEKQLRIYEYGMGNSTKWFAKRAKEVVSVDHDKDYFEYIFPIISKLPNVKAYLETDTTKGYIAHLKNEAEPFDVIVIDGRNRNACAKIAIESLSERGVIMWDNSDREEYQEGMKTISEAGFRKIEFTGMAPIGFDSVGTTIFYKDGNCLDI